MPVTSKQYKQYLINTQINYTCDYMSEFGDMSGDAVERFLKKSKLKPSFVWEQVKGEIVFSPKGSLIIDKVVLEHKNTTKIECAYKQWSGSSHAIVMGVGVVNILYYNPELDRYWIIDFRIWDKKIDGKKETELAMELLKLNTKRIGTHNFYSVLFDSFYASGEMLRYIGMDLKKIFYTNLPASRNCIEVSKVLETNQTPNQQTQYIPIKELNWTDKELIYGKMVYLKDIPKSMPVKLFSVASSERRIDNLCTNDIDKSTDVTATQEESSKRWKVEQFHREIKQTLGIAKCQCRKNRSQRNHILCSMLSWIYLTKQAIKASTTIYQIKKNQLKDYMLNVMKHPYWEYQGV
jgi:Transposase DDE domain